MFEFVDAEPRYKQWGRSAFIILTPLVFALLLFRGHSSKIYVSYDPLWIGNYVPSGLPAFLAEIVSYGYYVATPAAVLLAAACAVARGRHHRPLKQEGAGLVWYLPAFVAGIEAMRHAHLLGSRHGFTEVTTFEQIREDWFVAAIASVSVVVLSAAFGVLFARIARDSTKVPFTIVPVILSVVGGWFAQLSLLWMVA